MNFLLRRQILYDFIQIKPPFPNVFFDDFVVAVSIFWCIIYEPGRLQVVYFGDIENLIGMSVSGFHDIYI